jgi:hypothetical protein
VPRDSGKITATFAGQGATTAASNESSTSPRCSSSATARNPVGFTNASEPRASATSRPSSPWPAAASTSLGTPLRRTNLRSRATHRSRSLTDHIRNQ